MSTLVAVTLLHARSTFCDPFTLRPFAVNVGVEEDVLLAETVTDTDFDPLIPPLSVTRAVIVCDPAESTFENPVPVPIAPSMLEVQESFAVMLPSCVSDAEPLKISDAPSFTVVPDAGAEIVTVGAVLVGDAATEIEI
jgi:hypothetical protein